jgi:hypothetical protein
LIFHTQGPKSNNGSTCTPDIESSPNNKRTEAEGILNNEEFDRFERRPPIRKVYPRKGSRETIERRPPIRKVYPRKGNRETRDQNPRSLQLSGYH